MRHLEKKKLANFKVNSKQLSLKGDLSFPLFLSKTKNCMHNKCMGLYGNLALTLIHSFHFEVGDQDSFLPH